MNFDWQEKRGSPAALGALCTRAVLQCAPLLAQACAAANLIPPRRREAGLRTLRGAPHPPAECSEVAGQRVRGLQRCSWRRRCCSRLALRWGWGALRRPWVEFGCRRARRLVRSCRRPRLLRKRRPRGGSRLARRSQVRARVQRARSRAQGHRRVMDGAQEEPARPAAGCMAARWLAG